MSVCSQSSIDQIGLELIRTSSELRLAQQLNELETVSRVLIDLPFSPSIQKIGRLFNANSHILRGNPSSALAQIEPVVDRLPAGYRARGLLCIAGAYKLLGNAGLSTECANEAAKAAIVHKDQLTLVQSIWAISIASAIEGDHKTSLSRLESLFPRVQALSVQYPADFLNYLNSLSVELAEAGRIGEASYFIDVALKSPYAKNYPHWAETRDEIAEKPRHAFTPFTLALGFPSQAFQETAVEARPEPQLAIKAEPAQHVAPKAKRSGSFLVALLLRRSKSVTAVHPRPIRGPVLIRALRWRAGSVRSRAPPK